MVFAAGQGAIGRTARAWFRVVHYSVQADHVHLLVEADDKAALARGLMGVAIRIALAVNRVVRRRGHVWQDRYHARALRSPREVRNGIVYVLMNWKKHVPGANGIDRRSSASSFSGWIAHPPVGPPADDGVEPPATWLLRTGWKRHGLVATSERPSVSLAVAAD
jgi:hypothetical protein